ncbi:transcriptional regulator, TetR family [Streptomyces sp. TLI_053]|uniref:TetR/AcrR family transcriptional regulator n=1 Tax=Streptomyces sp. TLI_053 TaxID=1855352 RepID=UPI0008799100|nr:TetR/AcrR family transcriptional regulator [Streptomyces sp. TLI_053]SDT71109.1 transcriptional regulator, TetR family [Streptomyces sp. TLI_053]
MRADAERSRRRILDAACEVFLERGPDAPLDAVVRRAGVGPGTLYRRFPDREALVRALVTDLLTRLAAAADRAREDEPDPYRALRRFVHAAADLRMGAAIVVLLERLVVDGELATARSRAVTAAGELLRAAQDAGRLRADVGTGDLVLLCVRVSRPLPGGLAALDADGTLVHRHLDLALAGLRPGAPEEDSGEPLTFDQVITAAGQPGEPEVAEWAG